MRKIRQLIDFFIYLSRCSTNSTAQQKSVQKKALTTFWAFCHTTSTRRMCSVEHMRHLVQPFTKRIIPMGSVTKLLNFVRYRLILLRVRCGAMAFGMLVEQVRALLLLICRAAEAILPGFRPFRQVPWQGFCGLFAVQSVVCKTCGASGLPIACLFLIKQVIVQQGASCEASWRTTPQQTDPALVSLRSLSARARTRAQ